MCAQLNTQTVELTPAHQVTALSMVIPQIGLPSDVLPTVTAVVATLPNLGGVLGVGIIGTGVPLPSYTT